LILATIREDDSMSNPARKPSLYNHDYYAWLVDQARLLRGGGFDKLDCEHLAEELEDMGRSERRALESHLKNLLLHLLKWSAQPRRRSRSWCDSIGNARDAMADLLQDSPSLTPDLPEMVHRQYSRARRSAAIQTGIAERAFPDACPFSLEEILDQTFFPDAGYP
jgi:Domain of unknown function DUF29